MSVLVLSGGGQGGWGFLGALTELSNISFDVFIGTSVGGLIATLLIIGYEANYLFEKLKDVDIHTKPSLIKCIEEYGFCDLGCIMKVVEDLIVEKCGYVPTFKECKQTYDKDLIITGVCLDDRNTEYFKWETHPNMNVMKALYITCSVPILFKPIRYNDKLYVDGSLGDNFPINYAKESYEKSKIFGIEIKSNICDIKCFLSYMMNVLGLLLHKMSVYEKNDDAMCIITINNNPFDMLNLFSNLENKIEMFNNGKQNAKTIINTFKPLDCV